jgi:hypothetical protein
MRLLRYRNRGGLIEGEKNWAEGPLVCRNCGHDNPHEVHVYYIPSLPVECGNCHQMAMRPKLGIKQDRFYADPPEEE